MQTLVPPNLYMLLRFSRLLNISDVSYSNSLNRLNALSPYQKLVPIDNAWVQALLVKLCSSDNTTASLIKVPPLKVGVCSILEVHNMLITDPT